jgi:hypothetical protein
MSRPCSAFCLAHSFAFGTRLPVLITAFWVNPPERISEFLNATEGDYKSALWNQLSITSLILSPNPAVSARDSAVFLVHRSVWFFSCDKSEYSWWLCPHVDCEQLSREANLAIEGRAIAPSRGQTDRYST